MQMRGALAIAFKGVAMAMAALTVAMGALDAGDAGAYAILLAIGLLAMAVGSVTDHRRPAGRS